MRGRQRRLARIIALFKPPEAPMNEDDELSPPEKFALGAAVVQHANRLEGLTPAGATLNWPFVIFDLSDSYPSRMLARATLYRLTKGEDAAAEVKALRDYGLKLVEKALSETEPGQGGTG